MLRLIFVVVKLTKCHLSHPRSGLLWQFASAAASIDCFLSVCVLISVSLMFWFLWFVVMCCVSFFVVAVFAVALARQFVVTMVCIRCSLLLQLVDVAIFVQPHCCCFLVLVARLPLATLGLPAAIVLLVGSRLWMISSLLPADCFAVGLPVG